MTMDLGKEFEKFAVKDQGINPNYYDKIMGTVVPTSLTPNIIEERQMNVLAMDVFSRLMMDRIIFYGNRRERPGRKHHTGAAFIS